MYKYLKIENKDFVTTVTITREKALNAINVEVLGELQDVFGKISKDTSIRAVIVTGAGDKAFVAGADIVSMKEMKSADALAFATLGQKTMDGIDHCRQPVIAAVNGFCLGGGMELALACDFIYASSKAKLGLPEVKLGLFPGWGGTQRLPRLVGKGRAKEIIFSANTYSAEEAQAMGVVNKVCTPETLLSESQALAENIAKKGPVAVAMAKFVINKGFDFSLNDGLSTEREKFSTCFETKDIIEGIEAFLEKRSPEFKGQ